MQQFQQQISFPITITSFQYDFRSDPYVLFAGPTSNLSKIHNPTLRAIFNDENDELIGDGSVGGRRNGIIIIIIINNKTE